MRGRHWWGGGARVKLALAPQPTPRPRSGNIALNWARLHQNQSECKPLRVFSLLWSTVRLFSVFVVWKFWRYRGFRYKFAGGLARWPPCRILNNSVYPRFINNEAYNFRPIAVVSFKKVVFLSFSAFFSFFVLRLFVLFSWGVYVFIRR